MVHVTAETECKKMPTAARVDVQILSDTMEKNKNKLIGKLGDRGPCFPKLLTGLCIGQVVMLVATAATLGAIISENVSYNM